MDNSVEPFSLVTSLISPPGHLFEEMSAPTRSKEPHKAKKSLLNASPSSFNRGHLSGSVNLPYSSAFGPDGELVQCPGTGVLHSFRGRVIVVISHAMKSGTTVRTENDPGIRGLTRD
jgi:hypothetical protein